MTQQSAATCRSGVTLTEVLVAIFITGIGMISLLVLFPLGALNMAQAVKDQRAADASRIAEALARAWDMRYDKNAFAAYQKPNSPASGPSYIAYVDPQGCQIDTSARLVGGLSGINRIIPNSATATPTGNGIATNIDFTNPTSIQRWTTLQDELAFTTDGSAQLAGTTVERTPRYSWAWQLQQTKSSSTVNTIANGVGLTVIVYDRRPLVPGSGTSPLQEEVPCSARFNAGSNLATLSWAGGTKPVLKRGSWILDATTTPQINGYWYRVTNVTPQGANSAQVELHQNAIAAGNAAVVVDSVVEVFTKGQ
jgi:Tfp pilus assembly protein PilV